MTVAEEKALLKQCAKAAGAGELLNIFAHRGVHGAGTAAVDAFLSAGPAKHAFRPRIALHHALEIVTGVATMHRSSPPARVGASG